MEDIADWMIEQELCDPDNRLKKYLKRRYNEAPAPVKCTYCGQDNLWWCQNPKTKKWYLVGQDSKRHICTTKINNFTAGKEGN